MKWFLELIKYLFFGTGLFLLPLVQSAVFARAELLDDDGHTSASPVDLDASKPENIPDIEIIPIPQAVGKSASSAEAQEGAVSLYCVLLKPTSAGSARLTSRDPRARPACDLAFLQDDRDRAVLRKALRLGLALGRRVQQAGYPLMELSTPKGDSDAALDKFIDANIQSTFHYAGTCRIGLREKGGVVDHELRVHGMKCLRIADASVFPHVLAAHLQASVVMVGERCADFIQREWAQRET
jgi:choline dehydrogenase